MIGKTPSSSCLLSAFCCAFFFSFSCALFSHFVWVLCRLARRLGGDCCHDESLSHLTISVFFFFVCCRLLSRCVLVWLRVYIYI
jgi:hypothetical protein